MTTETRETLAAEGGVPVRSSFLPYHQPLVDAADEQAVVETLRSGWLTTGPRTKRFEKDLAAYTGASYCVAVNSCTAALHLALEAAGVGAGDEVITSPITFASTANVIVHRGARPVFVDVEPDTFNIDATRIERQSPRARRRSFRWTSPASHATSTRCMAIGAPPRTAGHRGRGALDRRRLQGPPRRRHRRHDVLLLLRDEEHHQRRRRRADDQPPGVGGTHRGDGAPRHQPRRMEALRRRGLSPLGHHRAGLQVQHVRPAGGARALAVRQDRRLPRPAGRAQGAPRRRAARSAGDRASRRSAPGRRTRITCIRSSCGAKCSAPTATRS